MCVFYGLWAVWAAAAGWWKRCTSWRPSQSNLALESLDACSPGLSAMRNRKGRDKDKNIYTSVCYIAHYTLSIVITVSLDRRIHKCCVPLGGTVGLCHRSTESICNTVTNKNTPLPSLSPSSIRAWRLKKITVLFPLWHFCTYYNKLKLSLPVYR